MTESTNSEVPKIRFKGFEGEWKKQTIDQLANRYDNLRIPISASKRIPGKTPYYGANGIQDYVQGHTHDGEFILVAEDGANDLKNYPVQFVSGKVWVNNHAHVLQAKDGLAETRFLKYGFTQINVEIFLVGGGRAKLNAQTMMQMELRAPEEIEEQRKVGHYFRTLDDLIGLQQRKHDKLVALKKAMLQKMFPQPGTTTPEIRFKGFEGKWEEKTLGECVLIQRGGSPRPIEAFITKEVTGVNWVKIGDVKVGSRYITETEEKIRPEGVAKSREVFKGDLILSNSMSFGRPYLMAIDGCIHDGWLLIRNDKGLFDLDYLLQLLSSDAMTEQYRALAAGGVVNNLNSALVQSTRVSFPEKTEQQKIGQYFRTLDELIAKHAVQLQKLKQLKAACLERMFA